MNNSSFACASRLCAAALLLTLASGCGVLPTKATSRPTSFYSLDSAQGEVRPATRAAATAALAAPVLIVNPPHAAAGFDSRHIVYVREAHKLEYFAHSEWVDTPARMMAPLIVAAVQGSGMFRAVVLTPSAAAGELRLDTEITRLQHDFGSQPSRLRFTLRAYIVDSATRRVLAWREFDESVAAESENPYGGVVAAGRAVRSVLESLAAFCADTARNARSEK